MAAVSETPTAGSTVAVRRSTVTNKISDCSCKINEFSLHLLSRPSSMQFDVACHMCRSAE